MLMSPNERDLNLHAENDLGEGIPRIQVVTGGSIGRSILKSNNKEIIFNHAEVNSKSLKEPVNNNETNGVALLSEEVKEKHIVPLQNQINNNSAIKENKTIVTVPVDKLFKELPGEIKSSPSRNKSFQGFGRNTFENNRDSPPQLNNKQSTTYVISNTQSCTLQLKSVGIGFKNNKVRKMYVSNLLSTHIKIFIIPPLKSHILRAMKYVTG